MCRSPVKYGDTKCPTAYYFVRSSLISLMANSEDAEGTYGNVPISEPVNIHEGAVSPKGSATDSEEQKEVSEMEEDFNDLENSPGIQEPMDVDSDMKPETVAESWADSMDDIETDPPDFQSHTYDRDNTTPERQDNAYDDHMPRQYIQRSRDSWRSTGSQIYHDRRSRSRTNNWRGLRGRGFGGREPRDRCFRGRGFRNRDFRSRESRYWESRGRRGAYRYPQRFIPRGPSIWNSQTRHDDYGVNPTWGRDRRNLDQDGGYQYRRSDIEQ
jgi:hypothetical protein